MKTIQDWIDELKWFDFLRKIKNILTLINNKKSIENLPIFASNATALTGGLKVNDLYRTTAGDIKIVV